jgi:hypothetical protein
MDAQSVKPGACRPWWPILLVFCILASGCALPLAWVTPPLDASAAVAHRDGFGRGAVAGDFEVVALPLNAWRTTADLPFDLGVGGRFHWARQASQTFARAEGRLTVPLVIYHDEHERLIAEFSGGATLDHDRGGLDPLGSVRLLWGAETFVEGVEGAGCESGDRSIVCVGALLHGQLGGFLFAEGALLRLGTEQVWLASAGVVFRVPASVGAGFVVGIP